MTLEEFARVVRQVVTSLPQELKRHLHNVVIDVEEEPDPDMLRSLGFTEEEIAGGESVYGLFVPMPLPSDWSADAVDVHELPQRIVIFKRPLEEDFDDRRQLMIEIRKTVIHELAHHFGYTDRDLERFDAHPNPFGDAVQDPRSDA
ncbi:MAG: hypothetical protein C4297_11870 [Gemmataceae bacterium]